MTAYAVAIPKFFAYLAEAGEPVAGVETFRARHVDGFEGWLEAAGLTRVHLFTVLVKIVGVLRQVAIDSPDEVSSDLRDRLRYVSAKPFQRPRPRDAYSPFVARQLRDAARSDVTAVLRRLQQVRSSVPDPVLSGMEAAVRCRYRGARPPPRRPARIQEPLFRAGAARIADASAR